MQSLVYTALVPHPPIMLPAVGGAESERVKATQASMEHVATELMSLAPDVVVLISPHGPVFRDAIAVHMLPEIHGDLSAFGAPEVSIRLPIDQHLASLVEHAAGTAGITVAPVTDQWAAEWRAETLDHGTMVPLSYLYQAGWRSAILPIAIGMLPPVDLYRFGVALQSAIARSGKRVAVLASGDLSHRLTPDAPAGYFPGAQDFDRAIVEALGRGDMQHLFELEHDRCEQAGECGLRPLMILAGVLDGLSIKPSVLSYEGPFGVGYAVVPIRPGAPEPTREMLPRLQEARRAHIEAARTQAHPLVRLARRALEHYVSNGMELDFSAGAPHEGTAPWQPPPGLPDRAGVFVSLKIDGHLRGCIGTTEPSEPTLALEVVRNAISAGTADPRFHPVEEEELPFIDYSVDVLGPSELTTFNQLDPQRFGLIVEKGAQRGLLLPDLAGVETADEQLRIACQKAGLDSLDLEIQLFRFRVDRYR